MLAFVYKLFMSYPFTRLLLELGIIFIFGLFVAFYLCLKKDYTLDSDSFNSREKEVSEDDKKSRLIKYAKNSFQIPFSLLVLEIFYPSRTLNFEFLNNSFFYQEHLVLLLVLYLYLRLITFGKNIN